MSFRLDGIDVSHWQGRIVWAKMPTLPIYMAKATHGATNVDPQFARNWAGMAGRCEFRGAYHFVTGDDPAAQADRFYATVGALQPGDFLMVDVEPTSTVPVLAVRHVNAVIAAITDRFGVPPVVYIGAFYPGAKAIIGDRPWWLPAYTTRRRARSIARRVGRPVCAWQWGGDVDGVYVAGVWGGTSRVDANELWRRDLLVAVTWPGVGGPKP